MELEKVQKKIRTFFQSYNRTRFSAYDDEVFTKKSNLSCIFIISGGKHHFSLKLIGHSKDNESYLEYFSHECKTLYSAENRTRKLITI